MNASPLKDSLGSSRVLSVAPMMGYTDRSCRFFHRLLSKRSLLYTEMVTAQAIIYGDCDKLIGYSPIEHPIACQLGGGDPNMLMPAAKIVADFDYNEVNLNMGCPSARVRSGDFGVCLMNDLQRAKECVLALKEGVLSSSKRPEVTVKIRIGVDDQNPWDTLPGFIDAMSETGIKTFIIHARKAITKPGFNPKKNNTIPPLDYDLVLKIQKDFPNLNVVVNGGINSLDHALSFLSKGLCGVMIGRAAYKYPMQILGKADSLIWRDGSRTVDAISVARLFSNYLDFCIGNNISTSNALRHLTGLFQGCRGSKFWRREISNLHMKPMCDQRKAYDDIVGAMESSSIHSMVEFG